MGAVIQPQDPLQAEITRPARSQEEVQDRFIKFKQMFADPKFQQALLMFGSHVLKQGSMGAPTGAAVGGGLQVGMGTYDLLNQQEQERQLAEQEAQRRNQLAGSTTAYQGAMTARTQQQTQEAIATEPNRRKMSDLELQKMEKSLNKMEQDLSLGKADLAGKNILNDLNAYKLFLTENYGQQQTIATLDEAKAQARAQQLKNRIAEVEARAAESLTPEESKNLLLKKSQGSTSAQVQVMEALKSSMKIAYPKMTEQEINQRILELQGAGKETILTRVNAADKVIQAGQLSGDKALEQQGIEMMKAATSGMRTPTNQATGKIETPVVGQERRGADGRLWVKVEPSPENPSGWKLKGK